MPLADRCGYAYLNEGLADLPGAFIHEPSGLWIAPTVLVDERLERMGITRDEAGRPTCRICGVLPFDPALDGVYCDPVKHAERYDAEEGPP